MVVAVFLPDAACKWWWWYLFSEQADWTLCFLFLYSIVTESQTRQAEWRMWKFSYFAITQSIKLNVDFPKHKTIRREPRLGLREMDLCRRCLQTPLPVCDLFGWCNKKRGRIQNYRITYLSHVTTSIFLVMMSKGCDIWRETKVNRISWSS